MESKHEPRGLHGNILACALDLSTKPAISPNGKAGVIGIHVKRESSIPDESSSCSAKDSSHLKGAEEMNAHGFHTTVLNSTVHVHKKCGTLALPDGDVEDGGTMPDGLTEGSCAESTDGTEDYDNSSSAIYGVDDHATSPGISPPVGVSLPSALPVENSPSTCKIKAESSCTSLSQSKEDGSCPSPVIDPTFPSLVPKTEHCTPTSPNESGLMNSANSCPVPSRPYSSMLPILSVPKVRIRQDRSEGRPSWTCLPSDSSTLNVGGYFLDTSGGSTSFPMEQSSMDLVDFSNQSQPILAMGGEEDYSSRPSLLQMALEHGSTQVNIPGNSQEMEDQLSTTMNSVGTCPTLPINPKNLGKAKPRTKTREKRYYQCEHCNIVYEQPRKLDRHLRDLLGKSPYQCCYCEMKFPTIGCRRFHSRLHEDKTMPCPYCPKIFNEKRRYEDHVRSHTGEAPFMCQECGNVYRTRSALRIHKRTHGNDKPLKCRFCPKRFIRIGDVQVHERTHTGEKPYKCGICESSFATSSQVNRHRRTHSEERPHECTYCNKTFKNPDYLITHEKMHLGHKPHHCKYCPKQFRTPRELVHHERVHTGEKPFECSVCGHRFSKKTNLKQHELQHTGVKSFKCAKCPKSFYRKASLNWHEKIHDNRERFLCKECGKLFFKESSRDKHTLKAHGTDSVVAGGESGEGMADGFQEESLEMDFDEDVEGGEPSEQDSTPDTSPKCTPGKQTPPKTPTNDGTDSTCEDCGKTFLARRSLLRHYRAIHNRYISRIGEGESPGIRPKKSFSCRICSETFLTDHLRHVHEGTHTNASFTCETCNKKFSTRQLLVKHQKIHSNVKPHVCETCGSAFTIKWYLNRHINIVHSDVYSYPCTICDKKFKAKTALSVHMQLHNVEGKVYTCDLCDAEFHVKRYLARHKRKYHHPKGGAGSSRRANSKHDDDDDDDDDDAMYDFDDNMDDGFDIMTDDSQAVSGVFLRQMLSKGTEVDDFKKLPEQPTNHVHSNSEDCENTVNNHDAEPPLGVTSKDDSIDDFEEFDGYSAQPTPNNNDSTDQDDGTIHVRDGLHKNRLSQKVREVGSGSSSEAGLKETNLEDGLDADGEEGCSMDGDRIQMSGYGDV